jgi:hypothetical protein
MRQHFQVVLIYLGHNSLESLPPGALCAVVLGNDASRPRLEKAIRARGCVMIETVLNRSNRVLVTDKQQDAAARRLLRAGQRQR